MIRLWVLLQWVVDDTAIGLVQWVVDDTARDTPCLSHLLSHPYSSTYFLLDCVLGYPVYDSGHIG